MNHSPSRDDLNDAKTKNLHPLSISLLAPNNYNPNNHSLNTGLITPDPTPTQQNTQDDTDINLIVQRFTQTGILPQALVLPTYGDFTTEATDYQSALHLVQQAEDAFASLPGQVRAHFHHNAAEFLEFIDNNPDPQLLLELGLADRISTPAETQPTPTAPPAPDPATP